ncbi:hypothetical protein B0H65DRAFT_440769 [Neurospora tetraspora]|uniref:STF2-like protein n=1 Tax=Neurospora tetraspora TaxID=94610 RepID=A0AAE0JM48_9PEZI|nr:hypothetical protein B0H65DRAFT_440769 [Neurospora tetraspora]
MTKAQEDDTYLIRSKDPDPWQCWLLTWRVCMTRSHKFNDKAHVAGALSEDGTFVPVEHVPKYFGKHGFADADPKKIKKNGGGKSNWGNAGDEVIDDPEFSFVNARRHSNASAISNNLEHFKTKFEVNEPEPVFEEGVHGAPEEEEEVTLQKTDTSSSGGSVDDEHKVASD